MNHTVFIAWQSIIAAAVVTIAASAAAGGEELLPLNAPAQARTGESIPALTTAEQVHRLTREEAKRNLHVLIRGVVTCSLPGSGAVVLQDSTRGIYADNLWGTAESLRIGEWLEIEGVTDPGQFAPLVHVQRLKRLGMGPLPAPSRPTWDQLINGSLDTQYVEIQGVVTAAYTNAMTLLTHNGNINILFFGAQEVSFTNRQDSLVRLRGCLFASWDEPTHRVKVGEIRMSAPEITEEEPVPADLFAAPLKRAQELLLFDPQASALRRVKLAGQVVQERDGEFFMMDGANGLRFLPRKNVDLVIGDLVEVVGFPSLTGPSPVLREALARRVGKANLPEAKPLGGESLFHTGHDATRVRVEGVLLSMNAERNTLEMQAGLRRFAASLSRRDPRLPPLPLGSRLELTGVYAGRGVDPTAAGEIGSFELLVSSPADIRVLARPPWWTFRHSLIVVGALGGVLVLALLWIRLLHHQVQERTTRLHNVIREREQADHQRALAQERARIARDLHDDLGSSLTEISMLATTGPGGQIPREDSSERLGLIAGKSRTMVHALDEIVWAIDPQCDTLASVARYLSSYAEEFLSTLNINCRVQIPPSFPEWLVPGQVRHHLFLAVKEALNNAARHGGATEIVFRLRVSDAQLCLSISDNGSGFDLGSPANGNGLTNLHSRLEQMGGRCLLTSSPGAGTTVSLELPLVQPPGTA